MHSKGVRRVAVYDASRFNPEEPSSWREAWVGIVSDTDIFRGLGQPMRGSPSAANGGEDDESVYGSFDKALGAGAKGTSVWDAVGVVSRV